MVILKSLLNYKFKKLLSCQYLVLFDTQHYIQYFRFVMYLKVFVKGLANQNRAVQDDIVAIEMLPEARWCAPSSVIAEDAGSKDDVLDEVQ